MKKSKLTRLIQRPLRFHHQDLHEEIEGLTALIVAINNRLILIENKLNQVECAREERFTGESLYRDSRD